VRKGDSDNTNNTILLADTSGLGLTLAASTTYSFEYYILFQSAAANTGIQVAINGPASPLVSYTVDIPIAADGAGSQGGTFSGWGTALDDVVAGTAVPTANTTYLARIHGVIQTGGAGGTLLPRFRSETALTNVTVKAGSWGAVYPG
jgi:hypothetical protein